MVRGEVYGQNGVNKYDEVTHAPSNKLLHTLPGQEKGLPYLPYLIELGSSVFSLGSAPASRSAWMT